MKLIFPTLEINSLNKASSTITVFSFIDKFRRLKSRKLVHLINEHNSFCIVCNDPAFKNDLVRKKLQLRERETSTRVGECIKGRGKHLSLIEVKFDNAATLESHQYTHFTATTTITTTERTNV